MHSFTTLASVLAFAAAVAAQDPNFDSIITPARDAKIPVGQTFTITWSLISATTPTGPATITLVGGTSTLNLHPISAIGHVNNADLKFEWAVDPGLGAEPVYGLNITLDADNSHFQYSNPFQIVGGAAVSSSAVSGSATTTSGPTSSGTVVVTSVATATGAPTTATTVSSTSGSPTKTTAATTAPTTTSAPQHPNNSTTTNSTSPTSASNKTTASAKPSPTSGATLNALPALGALAVALVASAAMHWGL